LLPPTPARPHPHRLRHVLSSDGSTPDSPRRIPVLTLLRNRWGRRSPRRKHRRCSWLRPSFHPPTLFALKPHFFQFEYEAFPLVALNLDPAILDRASGPAS